jgi:hypothetical protein
MSAAFDGDRTNAAAGDQFPRRTRRPLTRGSRAEPYKHEVLRRIRRFRPTIPPEQYAALSDDQKEGVEFGSLTLASLSINPSNLGWVIEQIKNGIQPLSGLHFLGLGNNQVGDEGVELLIESGILDSLKNVSLMNNGIKLAGVKLLSDATRIKSLKVLNLNNNEVGDEGVQAIAAAPQFKTLSSWIAGWVRRGR